MSETIKMTDSEVAEIRMLQTKFQEKKFFFGQLYLEKRQIEDALKKVAEAEAKANNEWDNLLKMENDLINGLLKKYGEGQLDLNAGTFITEKKPNAPS